MEPFLRIMHIDSDYQVFLMVINEGTSTVSGLSLDEALECIKTQDLDLILSEPQNMAIFNKTIPAFPVINQLPC